MDPAFAEHVRDLLALLASGGEPALPRGGLGRVLREALATGGGPASTRAAVAALADRWLRAPRPETTSRRDLEPLLNRPDVAEAEKLHAVLRDHVVALRRWQDLSSNESTFYRYRRAAFSAFADRLWLEVAERPLPTNRPRPEYARFVGRRREVLDLVRLLGDAQGGAVAGVEGPGGSGKTALLHAVADLCEEAARCWQPLTPDPDVVVPLFDAVVWVAATGAGPDLAVVLDTVARVLDYPGLLARAVEDRRQAVRDLLARRAVLLVVDDLDHAAEAVLRFLEDLPPPSRALVAARRRLPAAVRAVMPHPLDEDAVRELLLVEAERQGAPEVGRALAAPDSPAEPLTAAARYPLLAGWAVGQLRRGQTVERVRDRLARAEGEVFAAMFAASLAGLSPAARALLAALPLLPAPADRATLLAAGGPAADRALDDLLETSLLEVSGHPTDADRRYGLHAVTRGFVAAHLAGAVDRRAVVARLAAHYAALAEARGGGAGNWQLFGRLEAELPNLMACVEAASAEARERAGEPPGDDFDRAILSLAHGLRNLFAFGRAPAEGLALFHRAIEAARRLGDQRAEGWNTYRLGALHYDLGTGGFVEAAQRAREAAALLAAAGDRRGHGHGLRLLGRATRARGDVEEAARLLAEAERTLLRHGHGDDVAIARASQADLLRLSGRLDEAATLYERVLETGLDDAGTEANVRTDLGAIALARGDPASAEAHFAVAEGLAEAAGARAILARCRLGQARAARLLGDEARAARLAHAAADLFERLGDPERAALARRLLPG